MSMKSVSSVTIALLDLANRSKAGIYHAGQTFLSDAQGVMAGLREQLGDFPRQILVRLEPHHPASGRVTTRPEANSEA